MDVRSDDQSAGSWHAPRPADFFAAAFGRATVPVLADPAPDEALLQQILLAGISAPDHGRLSPWRFLVLRGAERERLGQALVASAVRQDPALSAERRAADHAKAFRAPLVVVVAAHIRSHPKIPELEQWLAVGACVQTLCLAAQALGFCANWKTGAAAHDRLTATELGFAANERIAAFLFIGTPAAASPRPRQLTLAGLVARPAPSNQPGESAIGSG